jgi:nitroreductase
MNKILENNKIIDLFNKRFATKKFDENKLISQQDIETIVEAGRLSPSSFGLEPWKFVVISNRDLMKKIAIHASGLGAKADNCSHVVIYLSAKGSAVDGDNGLFKHHIKERLKLPQNVMDFILDSRKIWQAGFDEKDVSNWTSKQTYIALGNMLTAAALLGIDSCPIEGIDKASLEKFLSDEMKLDMTDYAVSVMAAFGYKDMDITPKNRKSVNEVIHWFK